jgi:diguanylate cyclase
MSSEPSTALPSPTPDRLLARTCALVLAAALAVILLGQGGAAWITGRDGRMAEMVTLTGQQAGLARDIAARLERIDAMPAGPERRTAEAALGYEIKRLADSDRTRRRLAERLPFRRAGEPDTALLLAADAMTSSTTRLSGADVARLRTIFETTIVPEQDLVAQLAQRQADLIARHGQVLFRAGALGQILGLLTLGYLVLRPAVVRSRAWMAAAAESQEAARRRLLHDPLTQLPNATYLGGFLTRLIGDSERRPIEAAVLHVALDRFETLRESLGQRTATEIVRIAGRRVQQSLRGGDFAAHVGQDNFVVVATDLEDPNDAAIVAQRLHSALSRPYSIPGGARRIGCSIGVSLLSDDRPEVERLLHNAEIALVQARQHGSGGIRYFCERMRAEMEQREMLCAEFLAGLERGEIVPYFQPQLRLADGGFLGFEALARWNHPERGVLLPRDFLDVAEQADLTAQLGEAMLVGVAEAMARWDAAGLQVPCVGVNFALAQLHDPSLIERIKWEVDRRDIDPSRIAIEVLETVLIKSDADLVVRNLRGLAAAGFRIDLDDFGTGHASISNLRRFQASRVKIDRSFIRGIDGCGEQHSLVASIVAMAHALGIRTLAEGVETEAEETAVRAIGCDEFQGYRIAMPMDEAGASAWLALRRAAEAHGGGGAAEEPAELRGTAPRTPLAAVNGVASKLGAAAPGSSEGDRITP